jgi:uncharacterized protein
MALTLQGFHGVAVERLTENPFIIGGNVTCGIVGTAYKGVGLKLVVTLDEAIAYYGNDAGNSTLIPALRTFFKYGAGRVICSPITVANTSDINVTAKQYTFSSAGVVKLPDLYFTNVVVTSIAQTPATYTLTTDYTLDPINGLVRRVSGGGIAAGATVSIAYTTPGYEPTLIAINSAIDKLKEAEGLLGYRPNLIICPKYSDKEASGQTISVVAKLIEVSTSLYARTLIDTSTMDTATVISNRDSRTGLLGTSNQRVIICHPRVINSRSQKTEYLATNLAGIIAKVDREIGYWRSPDNQPLIDVSGVDSSQSLSMSDRDQNADNQNLNRKGIYSVVAIPGQGLYGWGQYNSSYPENSDIGKFIPIQQIEDILTLKLSDAVRPYIGQERGESTIGAIAERLLSVVNAEESLLPGSKVQYLPGNSTETVLTYSIKVYPKLPIEGIVLFLTQTVAL